FSSRRRHTRWPRDWSSDVCSSDLSYGARRGNHEVMVRGTFANVRLRNQLVSGSEGTWTVHLPDGEETTIYDAAMRYRSEGVPTRSEERRVGKECGGRWAPHD